MKHLEEFREQAKRAYNWTSFDPNKRGNTLIDSYEEALAGDLIILKDASVEEIERYVKGYKSRFQTWISAKSNCVSSMITGPANFPVEKNRKANDREHRVSTEFHEWSKKVVKVILKKIADRRPESEKHQEEWDYLENQILRSAATIVNIDLGIEKGCSRALFVSSIITKVEKYIKQGNVVIIQRATDLITNLNDQNKKPIISSKNKFWMFLERAEKVKLIKEESLEKGDKVYLYQGFKVVICYKDERIRIVHDEKPSQEVIKNLKSNGFRWSPFNKAWHRKITNNAFYVVKMMLKHEQQLKIETEL